MIWDKAEELGRLIGQTPEYKALRRSETTLREDAEAQAKVELIQTLARQMDELVSQGLGEIKPEGQVALTALGWKYEERLSRLRRGQY